MLDKARKIMGYRGYEDLFERYEALDKISFDYAVAEKEDRIQVARFLG